MHGNEALNAANSHFLGRNGTLEVLTDTIADAAADSKLPEPTVRRRRTRKIIPTVPQGGNHTKQHGTPAPTTVDAAPPVADIKPEPQPTMRRRG